MASRLTDAHIEGQRRLRMFVRTGVAAAWLSLPNHDEESVAPFLDRVLPLVLAGQRSAAHLTAAYLARALDRPPIGIPVERLTGAAVRNGAEPATVYRRPFVVTWAALQASVPLAEAVAKGLARARDTAEMDVALSTRAAYQATQQADDGIVGYQRVADPGACEYCSAIDGAFVKSADASPLHNNCGCQLEPVTDDRDWLTGRQHEGFAIHEHGELGAMIGASNHDFTGPEALK